MSHGIDDFYNIHPGATYLISYTPLRGEVDAESLSKGFILPKRLTLPSRPSADPIIEAQKVKTIIGIEPALLYIPGRRFDATGTRQGQGGGWYDRFLAEVPRAWLRVGLCFEEQLSPTPLKRETWDQAMDYVVVFNKENGITQMHSREGHYQYG